MAIVFEHIDSGRQSLDGLRLSGTVSGGDHETFVDFAEQFMSRVDVGVVDETVGVIVDMSDLGSISDDLAGAMASWQRKLMDHDGEMVFVRPNVVISWYLDRRLGPLPHRTFETVDEALAALSPAEPIEEIEEIASEPVAEEIPKPADPDWPINVNEAGRPDRISFAVVHKALRDSSDPALWMEPLRVMLRRTGLGSSIQLCRRHGDQMTLVGRSEYCFPANGWLGSLLASADCPLSLTEIAGDGLTLNERAFLKWCEADVLVPLLDDEGQLRGILCVKSERDGGLYRYRSGELLSLSLLGRLLARYLPAPAPSRAQSDPETQAELVIEELLSI